MTCLLAGASGLVGGELLDLLLKDIRYDKIISIGRRSLPITHEKLVQITTPLEKIESFILPACDVAFCCLGTTIKKAGSQEDFFKVDHDYVINFARAAKKTGVKKMVLVSALGADENSKLFYNKVKGQTENDLGRLNFDSLIIIQPSLLLGKRADARPLEFIAITVAPVISPFLLGPLNLYKPIRASHVAEAMLNLSFQNWKGIKRVLNSEVHSLTT